MKEYRTVSLTGEGDYWLDVLNRLAKEGYVVRYHLKSEDMLLLDRSCDEKVCDEAGPTPEQIQTESYGGVSIISR